VSETEMIFNRQLTALNGKGDPDSNREGGGTQPVRKRGRKKDWGGEMERIPPKQKKNTPETGGGRVWKKNRHSNKKGEALRKELKPGVESR